MSQIFIKTNKCNFIGGKLMLQMSGNIPVNICNTVPAYMQEQLLSVTLSCMHAWTSTVHTQEN